MNDYRVNIKVRNNRILKAIEESGGTVGQKWCDANGLGYTSVNSLINMAVSPVTKMGELIPTAARLCEVLGKLPDELWSDEQIRPLEKNFTSLEMSREQIVALMPPDEIGLQLTDFDQYMHMRELPEKLEEALANLDERKQYIIRSRFFDDKTLDELGKELGVSKDRVRQIEARALRQLRHPSNTKALIDYAD